jgi:fucose 4-O-acetylase-like acetyltransferase
MNNYRFQWVDIAKGIGIILVVYGHVVRGLHSSKIIGEQIFYFSDTLVYSFHMPLFFVLAGLFFMKSMGKYTSGKLFVEKCKTILYPYIIWSLFQTGTKIMLSKFTNGGEELNSLNSLLTCLFIPRAQFWFLFALFFINLFNLLLISVFRHIWLIISIIIGLVYYLFPVSLFVFSNALHYLIFFNIGILASNILLNNSFLKTASKLSFLVISILLFLIVEYVYVCKSLRISFYSLITALTGLFLVIQTAYKIDTYRGFPSKLLNFVGRYSLEIYILHILVVGGIRILLSVFLGVQNVVIHITLGTLCGVLIPFIITHLFVSQKWYKIIFRLS